MQATSSRYAIVNGLSYKALAEHIGININKNTYTKYVRDVGLVVGEALEKDRRTWGCKFRNAQSDEVSFRGRKYCRGMRVRNRGIQWGLTIVEVDEVTKKTTAVDLQFLPYNCRSAKGITPLIVQRMMPGGTLSTDCWRAYRAATQAAEITHFTLNHSETF